MPLSSLPHSDEWFDSFQKSHPLQAALTKKLIHRAGHSQICTTCGDPPKGDFKLQNGFTVLLRLCGVCHDIYTRTYGEKLTTP